MVKEPIKEKKPSDFEKWIDYIREKAKKYYWRDKMVAVIGEFPKVCPHAIPYEDPPELVAYSPPFPVPKDAGVWGECRCALYEDNKDKRNSCWYKESSGRCDCFITYWMCELFREWLKIKEINVVM